MALTDYTPTLLWFADDLLDTDIPTGTTKSNPSGTTDPTITGTPDAYADFGGSNGVQFAPAAPVMEVGTGSFTLVMKARIDTFAVDDALFENWDGAGSAGVSHGMSIGIDSAANRRISLFSPPRAISTAYINTPSTTLVAGQDFIVAFRRVTSAGPTYTWTLWLDVDASGGMVSATPVANNLAGTNFASCGDLVFGCRRGGGNPIDGRVYWIAGFDTDISDADLQLAAWDTESNLKTAWASGASGVEPIVMKWRM